MIKKVIVSKENIGWVFDKIYPVFKGDFSMTHFWQPVKAGFIQGTRSDMFKNRGLIHPKRLLNRKARMGKKQKYPHLVGFDYDNVVNPKFGDKTPSIFVGSRDENNFINIEVGDIFYFHSSGKFVYIDVDDPDINHIGRLQLLVVPMHFSETFRKHVEECLETTLRRNKDCEEDQMRRLEEELSKTKEPESDCYSPNDGVYPLCVGNPETMDLCKTCGLYENLPGPYDGDIVCLRIPDDII